MVKRKVEEKEASKKIDGSACVTAEERDRAFEKERKRALEKEREGNVSREAAKDGKEEKNLMTGEGRQSYWREGYGKRGPSQNSSKRRDERDPTGGGRRSGAVRRKKTAGTYSYLQDNRRSS